MIDALYAARLERYVTAMRNGQPDRVPLRPLAAEFTARYAGFTCQEVTHDYRKAFEAVIRCCRDFEWDAVVPNMVYVWTGLTEAIGLRYYGVPGIHVPPDVAFQYREPSEAAAFMKREEYGELIEDPVRFLYETWLPRVSTEAAAKGQPVSYRNNLSFVKGGMAMLSYFNAFGPQVERMRRECGTPSSICGMLKAPLDILADKLRGYVALAFDLMEIPETVLLACQALMPHLAFLALIERRSVANSPHSHLDASRLDAVHQPQAVRNHLLADVAAYLRRALGSGHASADVRRRKVGRAPGAFCRTAGRQPDLSPRPHRSTRGAPHSRSQILLERRCAERFAGIRERG